MAAAATTQHRNRITHELHITNCISHVDSKATDMQVRTAPHTQQTKQSRGNRLYQQEQRRRLFPDKNHSPEREKSKPGNFPILSFYSKHFSRTFHWDHHHQQQQTSMDYRSMWKVESPMILWWDYRDDGTENEYTIALLHYKHAVKYLCTDEMQGVPFNPFMPDFDDAHIAASTKNVVTWQRGWRGGGGKKTVHFQTHDNFLLVS